jgi:hypothetical protein
MEQEGGAHRSKLFFAPPPEFHWRHFGEPAEMTRD